MVNRSVLKSFALFLALLLATVGCSSSNSHESDASSTSTSLPGSETVQPDTNGDRGNNNSEAPGESTNGNDDLAGELAELSLQLTPVAELEAPIAMAALPGEASMYVAERGGTVRKLELQNAEVSVGEPLIAVETTTGSERGLLGLALSPNGQQIYLSYTDLNGNTVVEGYDLDDTGVDQTSKRQIFEAEQPFSNHNGGHLAFGPDSALYLGLGDGGSGGDPHNNAQDPKSVLGSIIRFDPETLEPAIWAIGLRNPWRFAWDFSTDDLWVADVGQDAIEEISVLRGDMLPQFRLPEALIPNFGWPIFEGHEPYDGGEEPMGYIPPVYTYKHGPGCSVVGGYVYRGTAIPALDGAYLYSDYCDPSISALVRGANGDGYEAVTLGLEVPGGQVSSFGEGPNGELYVMSLAGGIYRVE